jgi:hypothetical protein
MTEAKDWKAVLALLTLIQASPLPRLRDTRTVHVSVRVGTDSTRWTENPRMMRGEKQSGTDQCPRLVSQLRNFGGDPSPLGNSFRQLSWNGPVCSKREIGSQNAKNSTGRVNFRPRRFRRILRAKVEECSWLLIALKSTQRSRFRHKTLFRSMTQSRRAELSSSTSTGESERALMRFKAREHDEMPWTIQHRDKRAPFDRPNAIFTRYCCREPHDCEPPSPTGANYRPGVLMGPREKWEDVEKSRDNKPVHFAKFGFCEG